MNYRLCNRGMDCGAGGPATTEAQSHREIDLGFPRFRFLFDSVSLW